ncbi:hypothetical protein NQ317_019490 [Molorchus minor]|uniref:Uncharacterized protein n=1 Tax=Molorchus minor TaxID=1323400 RepID=A0ABQ9JNU4_9CUCU|nr:hypothetical protein NQ317_019490 [Molorchus minor]
MYEKAGPPLASQMGYTPAWCLFLKPNVLVIFIIFNSCHKFYIYILDIKTRLNRKKIEIYESTDNLDILMNTLSKTLQESQKTVSGAVEEIANLDLWRWLIILGHGESLICRPLYESPGYGTLSGVMDAGGLLYGEEGFFTAFITRNATINVAEVLSGKVVHNEVQKLVEIRNRILYKITALEVLLPPLNKQVNQSLSHLKTIQYFLDNQGWKIAERKTIHLRMENYLGDLYNHVNTKITKEIGQCRPLWEIFHSGRYYVCKLIVDPLNGIAFSCFFLVLLFLTIAPVVVKLVEYYRENNEDILASTSHR